MRSLWSISQSWRRTPLPTGSTPIINCAGKSILQSPSRPGSYPEAAFLLDIQIKGSARNAQPTPLATTRSRSIVHFFTSTLETETTPEISASMYAGVIVLDTRSTILTVPRPPSAATKNRVSSPTRRRRSASRKTASHHVSLALGADFQPASIGTHRTSSFRFATRTVYHKTL